MATLLILIFGAASGTLFSVLVGLIGSNRRIGFGWAFIASLLLTPFIGLIITLLSSPLPYGNNQNWGCIGTILALIGLILFIPFILALFGIGMLAAM